MKPTTQFGTKQLRGRPVRNRSNVYRDIVEGQSRMITHHSKILSGISRRFEMPYAIAVVTTNANVNRRIRENNDLEVDFDAEDGADVPLSGETRETLCFSPLSLAMVTIVRFKICYAAMYLIWRAVYLVTRQYLQFSRQFPQYWTNVQSQRTINFRPQPCSF